MFQIYNSSQSWTLAPWREEIEGWRYFKCFKSNSCGLKFERIVSIHTYLNFIWNVKLVKEYWTNVNMLKKHKRKVFDILWRILNHEENCSGKTDEIALSCVCVWLWHRQYYNSESFRIQFQRKNAFNTFSFHSQFYPGQKMKINKGEN